MKKGVDQGIDRLSGLWTSDITRKRYIKALKTGENILFCDLDDFKSINFVFGYAAGDQAIRELGMIIREHFDGCFCGRLGGEEFIVILEKKDIYTAHGFVRKVSRGLMVNPTQSNRSFPATISAGLGAGYMPTGIPECEWLLQKAKTIKNCLAYRDSCKDTVVFRHGNPVTPSHKPYLYIYSLLQAMRYLSLIKDNCNLRSKTSLAIAHIELRRLQKQAMKDPEFDFMRVWE
jgi:diguanylate cyclase (GGDEF)-like protein